VIIITRWNWIHLQAVADDWPHTSWQLQVHEESKSKTQSDGNVLKLLGLWSALGCVTVQSGFKSHYVWCRLSLTWNCGNGVKTGTEVVGTRRWWDRRGGDGVGMSMVFTGMVSVRFNFCPRIDLYSERRMFFAIECVSAVQGQPRSLILAPTESSYATSY